MRWLWKRKGPARDAGNGYDVTVRGTVTFVKIGRPQNRTTPPT